MLPAHLSESPAKGPDPKSPPFRFFWIAGALIATALMWANLQRAQSLGMGDHPCIWVYDAIPPAISNLSFHSPANYTSLKAVSDSFYAAMRNQQHDSATVARAIAKARSLDPATISRQTVVLGGDDKGIVDVVKLGFILFNYSNARIMDVYFILLYISIIFFIISFRDLAWPSVIAACFLVSHYMLLPLVNYNAQLQSVLALRYLPVLALFACLHCLFYIGRARFDPWSMVALFGQVVLLIFVVDLRSTTIWEVALVVTYALLRFAIFGWHRYGKTPAARPRPGVDRLVGAVWPAALALAGLATLNTYRARVYDHRYFEGEQITTRPFWHNILSGLAFNPFLEDRYRLKVDDLSEFKAAERFLSDHGRQAEWVAMGGTSPGYAHFRWANYDPVAKEVLLSILHDHPREFLATIFYYKPVSFLQHMAWIYGFRRDIPNAEVFVSKDLGDAMGLQLTELQRQLDLRALRFVLWNPLALAVILIFSALLALPGRPTLQYGFLPFALLIAGTFVPTLVGYPGMHTLSEPALILPTALYAGAALGLSLVWASLGRLFR
jgi:hypothetical protein